MHSHELDDAVRRAQEGDKKALAEVVDAVKDRIYYLSLRMLGNPDDAQDATQEIVIRLITRLSTFAFGSAFSTWVYRVASNHLLDVLSRRSKDPLFSFDEFREDLEIDLQDPAELADDPEYELMLNEVRLGCTVAMLLCLDRRHRLAYVLGDILELDHREASEVLEITPANFRQRLARARAKVTAFTKASCGLVADQAACRCDRKLTGAVRRDRVRPGDLRLAPHCGETWSAVASRLDEMQADLRTLHVQRAVPRFGSPAAFGEQIARLLEAAR